MTGGHFWIATGESSVLVANDTPQERRAFEPQVVRTFRLESVGVKEAMTAVRSIYGLKHVTADPGRQTLTVRDFAGQVALAEALIDTLDVETASAWRVRSGEVLMVELPGGFGDGDVLALALTPEISRVGTPRNADPQWISASMPGRFSPQDPQLTAKLRQQLRERLAELRRPEGEHPRDAEPRATDEVSPQEID